MSRHQNAGKLVTTASGKRGIIYNRDLPFPDPAGRVPVTLLDDNYQPILDDKQQPQKLLCNPANLTLTGFFD